MKRWHLAVARVFVPRALRRAIKRRTGAIVPLDLAFERETQDAFRRMLRPGDVAFDVGANIGELSVVLGRIVGDSGRVYSFEANPYCQRVFDRTIRMNRIVNCHLIAAAVTDKDGGRAELYLDERPGSHGGASSLMSDWWKADGWAPEFAPRKTLVRTVALDDFCRQRGVTPRLVKIDVEGAERRVLEGFQEGMRAARPFFLLEARSAGDRDPAHFVFLLEQFKYRIALLAPEPRWISAADFCARPRFERAILAAPAEISLDWIAG